MLNVALTMFEHLWKALPQILCRQILLSDFTSQGFLTSRHGL
jgi:hypothetical protein